MILIFAGILFLMIRASRKSLEEKTRRAKKLGFEPLAETPPDLLYRVEDLFKSREKQTLEIRDVFQRRELDRTLYIFDLVDTSGDDDSWLGSEMIGIISQDLALPRFSLTTIPSFERDRGLGKLMDGLLDKVLNFAAKHQNMVRIEFPEKPGFDGRFVVFGRDQGAVRDLVSRASWDFIALEETSLQFNGSGDFLAVDHSFSGASQDKEKKLTELYQIMVDLARRLER
jgi:hypothetical protein